MLEQKIQVFSYEYCEIFKNNFFIEHLWWVLLAMKKLWYFYSALVIGWRGYFRSLFSLVPPENIGKSLFDVFRRYRKRTLIGLKLVEYGHERGENKIVKWDNRD